MLFACLTIILLASSREDAIMAGGGLLVMEGSADREPIFDKAAVMVAMK